MYILFLFKISGTRHRFLSQKVEQNPRPLLITIRIGWTRYLIGLVLSTARYAIMKSLQSLSKICDEYLVYTDNGWVLLKAGAAPGCLLGAKLQKWLATVVRSHSIFAPALKKLPSGGGGGLWLIFFRLQTYFHTHFVMGYGILSWPWPNRWGWTRKKTKKKRKTIQLPPPPPATPQPPPLAQRYPYVWRFVAFW